MPSSVLRRLCLGAFSASASLALVAPAQAASSELTYTCTLFSLPAGLDVGDLGAEGQQLLESAEKGEVDPGALAAEIPELVEVEGLKVTASFDSAIKDGATATVGSTVQLAPVSTTIQFPAATVAALGDLDLDVAFGGSYLYAGIDETGAERDVETEFESLELVDGTLTATGEGDAEPFTLRQPGDHTFVAGDLEIILLDESETSFVVLECSLDEGQDATIDVVTAKAAATTAPPAPAPGPVRPDVVQTDAAQPASPSTLPLLAAGAGSVVVLGAASHLLRRRAARH